MRSNNQHLSFHQAGFSLVEILVGLVIGLLATLVIMQVFSVFEGQKRTTTGTADAQTNGSIALFTLERDLKMAGFGLVPIGVKGVADSPLECATLTIDAATGFNTASGVAAISPVIITDGGAGSDSITIHYGNSTTGGIPSQLTLALAAGTPAVATVGSNLGCQGNNTALLIPATGAACTMTSASAVPASTTTINLNSVTSAFALNDNLACLGTWSESIYSVSSVNNVSTMVKNNTPVIADIVNIQAQYGIVSAANWNTPNENQIVQWVNATGATWAAPTVANRNLIKAVRIAIVARNGLLEKEDVTSACNSLTADTPTGLCAWSGSPANTNTVISSPAPAINLSNDPDGTSWKRYRYRVFETIVPLRNVIWSKATL